METFFSILSEDESSARGSCSPQSVMLDFMTAIVGVLQVLLTVAAAVKSDKSDNNNNNKYVIDIFRLRQQL